MDTRDNNARNHALNLKNTQDRMVLGIEKGFFEGVTGPFMYVLHDFHQPDENHESTLSKKR